MWVLVTFTIALGAIAALTPRIPQPQSYHDFADQRAWLGIPNFGDVASNLLFAVSGVWGWDRLPMTLAFMGLVSAMISERMNAAAGFYLLPLLLLIGTGSVVLWWYSEVQGMGDLRFYAAVQVYAVLILPVLLLLPARYTRSWDFAAVFCFYVLAKIFETADRGIFALDQHTISGHTLKHLAAGAAGFWILMMLRKRRPLDGLHFSEKNPTHRGSPSVATE